MKKRVLSALMAVGLACSLVVTAFATADVSTTPAPTAAVESQNTETESSDPAAEADPTETPAETPAATQEPTPAPEESTPAPSEEPASSATPEPTAEPSAAPDDTVTATPTPTPEATTAPTPEATEEPAAAEPTAEPEATAEPAADNSADGIEYTAALEQDGQALNVIVTAPADAFGEDVSLVVAAIENTDETDAIAAELDESGVTYDGFAALDISFKNAAGEEVEPSAPVTVRIELPDSIVDSGIDLNTLAVQHLAEDADGNVTKVEQVASVADGSIALNEEAQAAMEAQAAENAADDTATTDEAAGVAPMMLAANNAQTDATAEAAAVAEFEVDGFSRFTITWANSRKSLRVQVVDTDGESIGQNSSCTISGSNRWPNTSAQNVIDLAAKIANEKGIQGRTFEYAALDTYDSETHITQLRLQSGRADYKIQYRENNTANWTDLGNRQVYFVFSDTADVDKVKTVDSTAEGVHMYMFKYADNTKQFEQGGYGETVGEVNVEGAVKENLVNRTTNKNGWPTFSGEYSTTKDQSLAWLFGGARSQGNHQETSAYEVDEDYAVNHLFLNSKYVEDGTFYYSAFENFATLDGKNFTVYDALGTPSGEDAYYFKRGNFMPYNDLSNTIRWYNSYDEYGAPLDDSDPDYGKPVYGLSEGAKFHFGMYVWADFYQPMNGQVENDAGTSSEDMIFEFTGDDDMWVFIDGVLVLDLGGIHDAQSGSINFATGEIKYTDTVKGQEPEWHQTTLKAQYEAANCENSVDWKGDTFADGSSHRIQIFYMERGEGASNLKMSFNLKTIPDGQLSVQKKVENYYAPQLADTTFTMQVKVNGRAYANEEYSIFGTEETGTTDSNGQFKLKHDQTAVFEKLTVNDEVEVSEVGSSDTPQGSEINTRYSVECAVTDSAGKPIDGSNVVDGVVTATMPAYGSVNVTVTNTATFTRPLKLVKQFDGTVDNQAPENFEATYTLYEVTDSIDKEIGSVKYSELVEGEYIFWLDTGKKYKIVETFEDNDNNGSTNTLPWQSVTVSTNDPAIGTQASDGIVSLDVRDATDGDEIDTITLTNHYGETTGSITIIKNIYGLTADEVETWIQNEGANARLRFDVDYFEKLDHLKNDEAGNKDFPTGWQDWNIGDWTFDVQDTLDADGFIGMDGSLSWESEVTGYNNDESINNAEKEHYTSITMQQKQDAGGESYFEYKMTLDEVDLNYWYRVWELHTDVPGYTLVSTVAEYKNGQGDDSLANLLVTESMNQGNHGGKATAFKLDADTKDVTVEFTNRYTPDHNDLSITKNVSGIEGTEVAGVTFNFTVTAGNNVDTSKLKDVDFVLKGGQVQSVTFTQKDGTYSATVPVQGTGTVTILGLPTGTYTVEEATPEDLDEYYYTGNSLNENNRDVEVSADAAGQITVTNNYEAYRTITVIKDVTGVMGDTSRFFDFTAKTGNENIPQENIQTKDNATAQVVGDGAFKLKDNGSKMGQVEIIKVCQNETVTITEESVANEGYTTSNTVNNVTSSVGNGNVATVTTAQLQEGNVTVKFTNYRPVVPPTGLESDHTTPYGLMVGAAGVAGAALVGSVVVRRRRRRQE